MKDYERVCACCSFRFAPSGEELYCGPCGRARVLPDYPLGVTAAVFDKDFARYSGHVCPLLWTAEEQRLVDATMRRWQAYVARNQNLSDEQEAELGERAKWDAYYDGIRIEQELRDRRSDTQRDDWEQRG